MSRQFIVITFFQHLSFDRLISATFELIKNHLFILRVFVFELKLLIATTELYSAFQPVERRIYHLFNFKAVVNLIIY